MPNSGWVTKSLSWLLLLTLVPLFGKQVCDLHSCDFTEVRNPALIPLLAAFVTASHESAASPIVTVLSLCFRVISQVRCAGASIP